jgi:hypothetical protein
MLLIILISIIFVLSSILLSLKLFKTDLSINTKPENQTTTPINNN